MTDPRILRARRSRRDSTLAETALWRRLREAGLPARVRRQHPIGGFVADFAFTAHRLIVEIDGGQHAGNAGDLRRTAVLEVAGWRVLRFWNHEVLGNPDGVIETIHRARAGPRPHRGRGMV
ncbi:endonuclease domain-containing protein [Zavarzinia sp.]|uniref:endonuclease domain-containing protein n=1 Tax=Zavarzinia sp. TaxID=2027920 RepID=UPI003BB50F65